jgi:hypothetical protein
MGGPSLLVRLKALERRRALVREIHMVPLGATQKRSRSFDFDAER